MQGRAKVIPDTSAENLSAFFFEAGIEKQWNTTVSPSIRTASVGTLDPSCRVQIFSPTRIHPYISRQCLYLLRPNKLGFKEHTFRGQNATRETFLMYIPGKHANLLSGHEYVAVVLPRSRGRARYVNSMSHKLFRQTLDILRKDVCCSLGTCQAAESPTQQTRWYLSAKDDSDVDMQTFYSLTKHLVHATQLNCSCYRDTTVQTQLHSWIACLILPHVTIPEVIATLVMPTLRAFKMRVLQRVHVWALHYHFAPQ